MPTVEIRYAGVVVGRGELKQEAEASTAFVASSEPLPVGTTVQVVPEGNAGGRRSARVVRSVEGGEGGGMGLRWLEADTDGVPEPVATEVSTETGTAADPSGPRKTSAWGVPAGLEDAKRKAQGNGGGGGGKKKKR